MIRDIDGLIKKVSLELQSFTDMAVIGLSGGADSTLVALLCKMALGKDNVWGVHMPFDAYDEIKFNNDSHQFATFIGISQSEFFIKDTCMEFVRQISHMADETAKTVILGNLKARVRMTALYSIAQVLEMQFGRRVRVIGTDNLSENFLGYFTKYGDGGVDINPIGELFKSEVYQLLDYFKSIGWINEDHINRTPSAGLWPGQTDEGELGHTYDDIEKSIRALHENSLEPRIGSECDEFVLNMYEKNNHKREMPPEIFLREFCDWRFI